MSQNIGQQTLGIMQVLKKRDRLDQSHWFEHIRYTVDTHRHGRSGVLGELHGVAVGALK